MRIKPLRGMNRRGSILVHVMMTGIVVALIAATLLRMSLMRYQMVARGGAMEQEKRADQAGLASVMTAWNDANTSCGDNVPAASGFTCVGTVHVTAASPPGICGCMCVQSASPDDPTLPHAIYTCPNDGLPCKGSRGGVLSAAGTQSCQVAIVSVDIK
ncbi:MAG: hypothetical protein ACHQ49_00715 [Elusimicrobiota bacterium]